VGSKPNSFFCLNLISSLLTGLNQELKLFSNLLTKIPIFSKYRFMNLTSFLCIFRIVSAASLFECNDCFLGCKDGLMLVEPCLSCNSPNTYRRYIPLQLSSPKDRIISKVKDNHSCVILMACTSIRLT